jgi:hypothetical protein
MFTSIAFLKCFLKKDKLFAGFDYSTQKSWSLEKKVFQIINSFNQKCDLMKLYKNKCRTTF